MAGQYIERLSLAPEAVDLSRLEGASVLDAHRQTAVRDVLGSVRSAAVDGKRGTALIQFSARPEVEPVWQDVLAGILRHVSVGYSVEDWAETTENGARVLTAVRWTPHEISLVPTPADPGAHIRMETEMTDTTTRDGRRHEAPTTETRAEANAEIRSIARIAGLDQSWIDGQIDGGADPDTARRAAFEALAKRSAPSIRTEQVRVEMGESQDDPALRARQMGEALYARINPRHELSEPARRYAYSTPVDMAKELLTLRGESTMALSPASLVTRALHTTSDFPIILGDTVGRVLRDAYQAAPSGIRRLGRQTTARDFRAVNKIMLGEAPLLEKLNEHGEIKAGTMAEAREAYKVETWARKIGITRQVLVNDDLGAFSDLARRMGQAAAETEARILVTLLEAGSGNGPTLSDGKTLFHADHGNKAGTGAAISDATLSAARLALRTQKGIEDRTIRVTPRNLLVPPALETTAEKWLASIAPATAADVNPFSGSLSLVVEPRLSLGHALVRHRRSRRDRRAGVRLSLGRRGPAGREPLGLGRGRRGDPGDPRFRGGLHRPSRLVHERRRVSMADLAQLTAWRDALMAARYRGVRTVEYDGKRVTYASDGEMAAALADLNRQIAGATDRISVVRIQSSKGL